MHKLMCTFNIHKNYFIVGVLNCKTALAERRLNVFVGASKLLPRETFDLEL